jgi:hypothetical protein
MREPYICPYCDQRSTRRWNLDVHIKRKHGGFLLDGSSGQHMGSNPLWYKFIPYRNIGSRTVADSIGNTFEPRYLPQQVPLGRSQYSPSPIYPPWQMMENQINQSSLSAEKIQKIQELKLLMNKYPRYHTNPDSIVRLAVYNSINGDNTLLNDKLEQLRTIDSLAKY